LKENLGENLIVSIQKSAPERHWERQDNVCMLVVTVLSGFAVQLSGSDQIGLAEDGVNKI
jgi:hypothetical protein